MDRWLASALPEHKSPYSALYACSRVQLDMFFCPCAASTAPTGSENRDRKVLWEQAVFSITEHKSSCKESAALQKNSLKMYKNTTQKYVSDKSVTHASWKCCVLAKNLDLSTSLLNKKTDNVTCFIKKLAD